jgi:hypothetical protein
MSAILACTYGVGCGGVELSGFDSPCTAPGPRGDAPASAPTGLYRTANADRRSPLGGRSLSKKL